jgi:O-antigen/teichoic acid export membrane protein
MGKWVLISEDAYKAIVTVLVVIAAFSGLLDLSTSLIVQVCGAALALPIVMYLAMKGSRSCRPRLDALPSMIRYGFAFAANLFLITLLTRIPMMLMGFWDLHTSAGHYFAALRVNEIFLETAATVGLVLFSRAIRDSDAAVSMPHQNSRIACWFFYVFSLAGLMVALIATTLVTVILGDSYSGSAPVLAIMAIGLGPAAASKIVYSTIAGTGKPWFGTIAIVTALACTTAGTVVLVPEFDVYGAAVSVVFGQFALYTFYAVSSNTKFGVPINDFFVPRVEDGRSIAISIWKRLRRKLN